MQCGAAAEESCILYWRCGTRDCTLSMESTFGGQPRRSDSRHSGIFVHLCLYKCHFQQSKVSPSTVCQRVKGCTECGTAYTQKSVVQIPHSAAVGYRSPLKMEENMAAPATPESLEGVAPHETSPSPQDNNCVTPCVWGTYSSHIQDGCQPWGGGHGELVSTGERFYWKDESVLEIDHRDICTKMWTSFYCVVFFKWKKSFI
jgi:hypothetical protein